MKIKALLLGCMLLSGVASAQMSGTYSDGDGDYKPSAGAKSFEVNFSPFSGSPISISSPIGLNYLRGRYFTTDNTAYRLGASLVVFSSDPNSSFELGIAPGIEKHFEGTSRLSPYVGAELVLGLRSSSASWEAGGTTTKVSGAFSDASTNRGFFNFGLNGVIGCDYYFAKHIFVGFEAGFGINYINWSQVQTTTGGGTPFVDSESRGQFVIAPSAKSALRLGFVIN